MKKSDQITKNAAYEAVAPDDFASMIEVDRYGQRSSDFDKIISFGDLTWPHKMFKMMLLEQIYRSITIINKHPYHK